MHDDYSMETRVTELVETKKKRRRRREIVVTTTSKHRAKLKTGMSTATNLYKIYLDHSVASD